MKANSRLIPFNWNQRPLQGIRGSGWLPIVRQSRDVSTVVGKCGRGGLRGSDVLLCTRTPGIIQGDCNRPIGTSRTAVRARAQHNRRYASSVSQQEGGRVKEGMEQHNQTVSQISAAVQDFHVRKEKFRINHGSTNSTRNKSSRNLVDTGSLSHVLKIDTVNKTCLVEPNVPMDRLVEATMKYGLVPPVVMEFPGITVGGGYNGTSGESSSWRHGWFDRSVRGVEMVLGDGEVVWARNSEKEGERGDLFEGGAGAVGTLGVTTLVELALQDAKKYVETTYWPVKNMKEAIKVLNEATGNGKGDVDYVDGIMFSPTQGAIITGRLTDTIPSETKTQTFSSPWDPWFYMHVQSQITTSPTTPTTEAIPLAEYLFRYDRGGFWVGKSAFDYFKFPFNRLTRWWLDDFVHTRMMYTALHASGEAKKYIVQDLALPYETAEEFVEYTTKEFNIWPLWLCPLKRNAGRTTMHPHSLLPAKTTTSAGQVIERKKEDLMLNIGLWGFGPKNHEEFVRKNRELERKLTELGGMKWLYAHTYYGEEEFWGMFDRTWYEGLRKKYKAEGLASVWEKVWVDVEGERRRVEGRGWWEKLRTVWPWGGFYGIWMAIKSKSYVASRGSSWKEGGEKVK